MDVYFLHSAESKRPFCVSRRFEKGGEQMEFDYFYGPEDAEQYQFYRIPKLLITSEQFKDISVEAKLLYGLMLDRLSLSIKNGWFDSLNRAYIIYTIDDVMTDTISRRNLKKMKRKTPMMRICNTADTGKGIRK